VFIVETNDFDRARIWMNGERVNPDLFTVFEDGAVVLRWDHPEVSVRG
jgi:hypothetical protein